MPKSKTKILDGSRIQQKINRMAFQIYEDNVDEKEVLIAGIRKNGYLLAERIAEALKKVSPLKVKLIEVELDKHNPIKYEIELPLEENELKDKVVILVDDVLNSGKTLIYGARRFLRQPLKKLRTVVLVNRAHTRYPIHADFEGMSLSSTLQEHVEVVLDKNKEAVYLL
ncbi:MAG: phosphoribosyltransferase [Flavobacteriales bacterium]|nr:phosphoribosyltransferase [Flavobacteriales bacterium]MCB9448312.1 phosphoribosyltransferase [Flavobacteriales bacterium]